MYFSSPPRARQWPWPRCVLVMKSFGPMAAQAPELPVAEAQRRRLAADGPPRLFVYNDGDPIDEDRLAGFAWRLRSRERRHSALLGGRST